MRRAERLEYLGRLCVMLKNILDNDIFAHTESKHSYESWVEQHHNKLEYGEPKGLDNIHRQVRLLREEIEECYYLAKGDEDE